jgi:hypothetical protein
VPAKMQISMDFWLQLKEVIILHVNQGDLDRSISQLACHIQAAEACTNDDSMRGVHRMLLFEVVVGPLVEVDNGFTATHSLYPDVLDAREIRRLIDCGDEHLRGEGLVYSISLPIEIGDHHNRIAIGHHRF